MLTPDVLLVASDPLAPPVWSAVPFAGLLLCIAALPLVAPEWWHSNRNKAIVSCAFGIPVGIYAAFRDPASLAHTALEYLAFVSLLGSLYVISGNIVIRGSLPGTPASNTLLLAGGALLTNLVGTTGAAMLLIRPFLKANRNRPSRVHQVVFFILIVANCGGCLTPLGDPPLFLGFLKGVPFEWTLRLWKEWLLLLGCLLACFYLLDRRLLRSSPPEAATEGPGEPVRIAGKANIALLVGVIGVVLAGGFLIHPRYGETAAQLFQSGALGALAVVSLISTPKTLRQENEFSWHPYLEVAILFAGIFTAMIPALSILRTLGPSLGISKPWQFFFMTGGLSAFLDNAPTYLAFLSLAQNFPDEVAGTTHRILQSISSGSVFFGALTYIGNGPNFMVKAIAEHRGVKMPSFFGYLGWSLSFLGPVLLIIALLFFR
ncbi:MAG TPA: sodium:proton antiporter [Planctomycetota bacterium]|nr:sodium:proton antiporter [Planctomycetota bacterium]